MQPMHEYGVSDAWADLISRLCTCMFVVPGICMAAAKIASNGRLQDRPAYYVSKPGDTALPPACSISLARAQCTCRTWQSASTGSALWAAAAQLELGISLPVHQLPGAEWTAGAEAARFKACQVCARPLSLPGVLPAKCRGAGAGCRSGLYECTGRGSHAQPFGVDLRGFWACQVRLVPRVGCMSGRRCEAWHASAGHAINEAQLSCMKAEGTRQRICLNDQIRALYASALAQTNGWADRRERGR